MHARFMLLAMVSGIPAAAWADTLDLFAVQPVALDADGEIAIQGMVHSHYDGAVLDAMTSTIGTRSVPGGLVDAEAGGLRVVWRDPEQHQYRLAAMGVAGSGCRAAEVASPCLVPRTLELAQARLLTVADFARSLSGEVEVKCSGSGGLGARLAWLVHAPWEYDVAAMGPFIALAGWCWLRKRQRRTPTLCEQIFRLASKLSRRLRQGDPVHRRLLPPIQSLTEHARRLEHDRRLGLAEGWPGETERSTKALQEILKTLLVLGHTLDEATRAGRATLDDRLLGDLQSDLQLALAANSEAEGLLRA